MRLSRRRLNRTLLLRQHLLERVSMPVAEMSRHLIGLQAQENLPPFLSLAARLTDLDPYDVTRGLEDRSLVRLLTMRGTVHLLTADDALMLRQWTAPVHEREIKISQSIAEAREVDRDAFVAAVAELLADAPMPQRDLGAALVERFPAYPATKLGQLARSVAPLAQIPPRGTWKGSGGVVYQHVDRWVGRPLAEPDVEDIVRRYLRAFGPATAADVTAWSAVTRLGPTVKAMDDLVQHEDENGKVLYDVADAPIADEDAPAPVRLLGQLRQRLALPRPARPGHRAREAQRLDGPERRPGDVAVRGRLAGRALGARGRQGPGGRAAPAPHQDRAGRARRGVRPRRGPDGPLTRQKSSRRVSPFATQ